MLTYESNTVTTVKVFMPTTGKYRKWIGSIREVGPRGGQFQYYPKGHAKTGAGEVFSSLMAVKRSLEAP